MSRLPVVQEARQDCSSCRNRGNCWAPNIKEEHIMTNLLVCRIKRGIEVNRSSKMLLTMLRPKLRTLARFALRGTNITMDVIMADLESATIEALMKNYVMGEIAYPLHYLFGHPNGVIRHYANNYGKKARKYQEAHYLVASALDLIDAQTSLTYNGELQGNDKATRAREVIEDGMTLSAVEYRVIKFCLDNATEAKRPLNGLHVHLARTMGVIRARVTKVYSDATKKVVAAVRAHDEEK